MSIGSTDPGLGYPRPLRPAPGHRVSMSWRAGTSAPGSEVLLSTPCFCPINRLCSGLPNPSTVPQTCSVFFIHLFFTHAILPAWNTHFCPCLLCGLFTISKVLVEPLFIGTLNFHSPTAYTSPSLNFGGPDSDHPYCSLVLLLGH